jgi:hypothetical protein
MLLSPFLFLPTLLNKPLLNFQKKKVNLLIWAQNYTGRKWFFVVFFFFLKTKQTVLLISYVCPWVRIQQKQQTFRKHIWPAQWLMLVIPDAQEAEIGKISV